MPAVEGTISITGLPPNRGIIVSICFFGVVGPDSPPPYNGDPPAEAAAQCEKKVCNQVDLDRESQEPTFEHSFAVEESIGYYYPQVRVILFRVTEMGQVFAQAEQFFFTRGPIRITHAQERPITLPVSWPTDPLETLHVYGTISPPRRRPWWKFW